MLSRLRRRDPEGAAIDAWMIAGLGNPGPSYAGTRHNVGYLVADELLTRGRGALRPHRSGRALVAQVRLGPAPGIRFVVVRARAYMNESGPPIAAVLGYYKIPSERLVVVHDELDLPYGDLRAKLGGGDNGHNGLRSLRAALGTGDFHRVRVGVGRPPGRQDPADFVLRPFSAAERQELGVLVQRAADCVESLAEAGLAATQSRYNS